MSDYYYYLNGDVGDWNYNASETTSVDKSNSEPSNTVADYHLSINPPEHHVIVSDNITPKKVADSPLMDDVSGFTTPMEQGPKRGEIFSPNVPEQNSMYTPRSDEGSDHERHLQVWSKFIENA